MKLVRTAVILACVIVSSAPAWAQRTDVVTLMNGDRNNLPQSAVDAYWSVILVGVPDFRVVDNALKRYNFNNHSPLKSEPDGSLKIGIGPKAPAGVPESNWLPSLDGKPFSLTFRTYVPKDSVKRGEWIPPAVTRSAR